MTRLNLFLVIAIILSAIFLVHSHYQARRSFMVLEAAMKETARLEIEHERLQIERRSQASPLRIEQIAKQQLQMRLVTPGVTQYVKQPTDMQTLAERQSVKKAEKPVQEKP
jgi:cell division protein FtsL